MPKHKKKWIDGSTVKFRLVPQNLITHEPEPIKQDDTVESVKKKDAEEHIKFGIYFDDDYDYMQHLRDLNEVGKLEKEECFVIKAQNRKVDMASTLFEKEGVELNVELLKERAPQGLVPDLDPEIAAALEGDFNFDDPNNELDDDFIIEANGGEIPSNQPPHQKVGESYSMQFREGDFDSDEDGSSNQDEDGNIFEKDSVDGCSGVDSKMYPSASAVGGCEESHLIDKNFDKLYEDYERDEMDCEDQIMEGLEPNTDRMKMLAAEYKHIKEYEDLVCDDDIRRFALAAEAQYDDSPIIRVPIEVESGKPKWDCESVLSTYSNTYNHPTVIAEPSRKRKLKNVLRDIEMDDSSSVLSTKTVSTVRPPDETPEERKIRKAAVREARAERRMQKKNTKLAFRDERKKLSLELVKNRVKFKRIV